MVGRWSWFQRGCALVVAGVLAGTLAGCGGASGPHAGSTSTTGTGPVASTSGSTATGRPAVQTVPGMPPVVDPANIYSQAGAGMLGANARRALPRVYVPDRQTNNVLVIDPTTFKVLEAVPTGVNPQHVVPSYDLSRLWVVNNSEADPDFGTLTPIDPVTAKFGPSVRVEDPYNMYFTPDGAYAIVVAEALRRLDFRDPVTMALRFSLSTPTCPGINHMDFSADGSYLIATCEDANRLVKVDWAKRRVVATLDLGPRALPQDIRLSPDGRTFYVADMMGNRLILVDGDSFSVRGSVDLSATGGFGAHGLYPSRDARYLYVANRGSAARGSAPPRGRGSVSVVDFATNRVVANWPVPGGGSPDMGGVSADGHQLWLSGRYDNKVYVFDTRTGHLLADVPTTPAGVEPHGLCVWPQPGRYSLGHTGNTR
ncbi:MAG TPA: YncE family protein [Acidimicrobiales bacterium]|nr:YncE family protein [Acidimicrobiales bacterium]